MRKNKKMSFQSGTKTKVINLYKEKYDVYIGRPGKGLDGYFGNPFKLEGNTTLSRKVCLEKYREWFYKRINEEQEFKERILSLKGKTLGCFCKPKPCHGDVIVEYLENG